MRPAGKVHLPLLMSSPTARIDDILQREDAIRSAHSDESPPLNTDREDKYNHYNNYTSRISNKGSATSKQNIP